MNQRSDPRHGAPPLRYLLAVPWELAHPGGVNQVVRNLSDRLSERGSVRPWILVKSWDGSRSRPGRTGGRRTLRMRLREPFPLAGGRRARLLAWLVLPARALRLGWWLRRRRVAVVNAHYPGLWLLPVAVAGFLGIWPGRLLLSLHGQDLRDARQWSGLQRRLWVWLCARSAAITACSEALAEEIRADLPGLADRVRAVPNGVDPARVRAAAEAPPRSARPYIACVATYEHKKGQDVLLGAFARLAGDYPELDLVLAGRRAECWDVFQGLATGLGLGERVRFLAGLEHGAALGVIREARLFVLPSRYEPFGIVLLEAGVLGVPVVASRVGGIPQVVRDRVDGLLVPPGDPAALEAALRDLLEDPERARLLARSLKRRVAAEFSWERAADRYLALAGVASAGPAPADAGPVHWRGT